MLPLFTVLALSAAICRKLWFFVYNLQRHIVLSMCVLHCSQSGIFFQWLRTNRLQISRRHLATPSTLPVIPTLCWCAKWTFPRSWTDCSGSSIVPIPPKAKLFRWTARSWRGSKICTAFRTSSTWSCSTLMCRLKRSTNVVTFSLLKLAHAPTSACWVRT